MKVVAFVSELNPFHKGHEYLINKIKESYPNAGIITIMSGDYVQRGEPAIFDKYTRGKTAIIKGCDLVLELPALYVLSNAESFAYHSIRLLHSLQCVDVLAFGAEHPNLDYLLRAAKVNLEVKDQLQEQHEHNQNLSFNEYIYQCIEDKASYRPGSNDILAIEYLAQSLRYQFNFKEFYPIQRIKSPYNEHLHSQYAASSIRNHIIKNAPCHHMNPSTFFPLYKRLGVLGSFDLNEINEGDESRIRDALFTSTSYQEFLKKARHKRLSPSRIRRNCLSSILEIQPSMRLKHRNSSFIRPIASSKKGLSIVSKIASQVPIIQGKKAFHTLPELTKELFLLNDMHSALYRSLDSSNYKSDFSFPFYIL
ncbi:MAG: nucleotidyltransferase family protein [Tissierellia bacterium]|nr:nucleotidyltransferase family protein [Tissierellia bacterium]